MRTALLSACIIVALATAVALEGCAPAAPPVVYESMATQAEYEPYLSKGSGLITGQAFLKTRGGDVKVGAGSVVTLDPVTELSTEWWLKAAQVHDQRGVIPPDSLFLVARHVGIVDARGDFGFSDLPYGSYYVRSTVTWLVPGPYDISAEGGVVHAKVTISEDDPEVDVMLTWGEAVGRVVEYDLH